jgi:hypothetical protein
MAAAAPELLLRFGAGTAAESSSRILFCDFVPPAFVVLGKFSVGLAEERPVFLEGNDDRGRAEVGAARGFAEERPLFDRGRAEDEAARGLAEVRPLFDRGRAEVEAVRDRGRAEDEAARGFSVAPARLGWIRIGKDDIDEDDDDDDEDDEEDDDDEALIIACAIPKPSRPSWLRKYKDAAASPLNIKSPAITAAARYPSISLIEMLEIYNSSSFALISPGFNIITIEPLLLPVVNSPIATWINVFKILLSTIISPK